MTGYIDTSEGWREAHDGEPIEHREHVLHFTPGHPVMTLVREELAPPLPTQPGYYLTTEPDYGGGPVVVELLNSPAGQWVDAGDRQYLNEGQVQDMLPLDRLEPRAVTAKAVLDRVRATGLWQLLIAANPANGAELDDIAREFGVES